MCRRGLERISYYPLLFILVYKIYKPNHFLVFDLILLHSLPLYFIVFFSILFYSVLFYCVLFRAILFYSVWLYYFLFCLILFSYFLFYCGCIQNHSIVHSFTILYYLTNLIMSCKLTFWTLTNHLILQAKCCTCILLAFIKCNALLLGTAVAQEVERIVLLSQSWRYNPRLCHSDTATIGV